MIVTFLRRAALALLSVVFAGAVPEAMAAPPLLVTFQNNSGFANSDVYIGFVGGNTLAATNVATGAPLALSAYQSEHWYTLDTLPQGIDLSGFSGRIYVGYGAPWSFLRAGYEPPPSDATDPNYLKRFDKVEITYFGQSADVANTTSIDYFSIPIALNVYHGGLHGTLEGSVNGSATNVIVGALGAVSAPANAAVVKDLSSNFVRVIGPTKYPPPPGLPASPYDDFDAYLTYLRTTYAPAYGNVATIKGNFAGVGDHPTTAPTMPQTYDFTATIDSQNDITLTGSGSVVGGPHQLVLQHAAIVAPTGIYGANPAFSLDGAPPTNPGNDLWGWLIGDLFAGINIGAVGSTVPQSQVDQAVLFGQRSLSVATLFAPVFPLRVRGSAGPAPVVGQMDSQDWFKFSLGSMFDVLQPGHRNYYNQYAAALTPISQAYGFAYSDRFAHVVAPLNPTAPQFVDTLQIVLLPEQATVGRPRPGAPTRPRW
jgi:hypothetical protein